VKRDEAVRILTNNRDKLREFSIRSLAIFGSVARDEATDASDVDVLVDFEPGARIGLFRLIEIQQFLEGLLGCPVDLGTADTLRERIRDKVLKEAIRVAWGLAGSDRRYPGGHPDRSRSQHTPNYSTSPLSRRSLANPSAVSGHSTRSRNCRLVSRNCRAIVQRSPS
jgi:uncharacterized protein